MLAQRPFQANLAQHTRKYQPVFEHQSTPEMDFYKLLKPGAAFPSQNYGMPRFPQCKPSRTENFPTKW